jgi:GDP-4-dehydro-6-deoxy-D-mannose reductase
VGRTVLLIGTQGFAGEHFRAELDAEGFEVVGAARRPPEGEIACDLLDPGSVAAAVRETKPDVIANLAGAASVAASWRDPAATLAVNCLGTLHMLEAVAREAPVAQVLCVSSADVYGAPASSDLPLTEDHPPAPLNPYGASKAAMEIVCGQYERARGLVVTVARAFNHIGPGQSDRFAASSLARQVAAAERSGAIELTLRVGDLRPVRDFTDVRDTVRAYRLLVEKSLTGTYNVCSGAPTPLASVVEALDAATPLALEVEVDQGRLRPTEVPILYGSHERLTTATGWEPEIPLERSIADLLEWWRARPEG